MFTRVDILKALSIYLLGAFFMSCSPRYNPHSVYPDFKEQITHIDTALVVVDATIVDAKRNNPINIEEQIEFTTTFSDLFISEARRMDVPMSKEHFISSGFYLENSYGVIYNADDENGNRIDTAFVIKAPFYLSESLSSDPLFMEELRYTAIDTLNWDKEIDSPPKNVVYIVLLKGKHISKGLQLSSILLTGIASGGSFVSYYYTGLTGEMYVFDRDSGALLWRDHHYLETTSISSLSIQMMVNNFLGRFGRVKRPYRP